MPQAGAMSRQPLPPQARPAVCTPPSPRLSEPEPPQSAATLTPPCLGREQTPSGNLHAEAGLNPNLNPRGCANKEEKGKSLHATSGAVV